MVCAESAHKGESIKININCYFFRQQEENLCPIKYARCSSVCEICVSAQDIVARSLQAIKANACTFICIYVRHAFGRRASLLLASRLVGRLFAAVAFKRISIFIVSMTIF